MIEELKTKYKKQINKISNLVMYVERAKRYFNMASFVMIFYVFLDTLIGDSWLGIPLEVWFVPVAIVGIIVGVGFGFFEDKLGFFCSQETFRGKRNGVLLEILEEVKKK